MRDLIEKHHRHTKSLKYIDVLDDLVDNYNSTVHSSLDKPPDAMTESDVLKRNQEEASYNKHIYDKFHDIEKGAYVRVINKKGIYDKGASNKVSDKIYKIEDVNGNQFILSHNGKSSKRPRYLYELIKADKPTDTQADDTTSKEIKAEEKRIKINRKLKREGLDVSV